MNKHFITVFIVLVILGIIATSIYNKSQKISGEVVFEPIEISGSTVPIDTEKSFIKFIGKGGGRSQEGTFTEWEGNLFIENGVIVGAEGTINTNSVTTGIAKLDSDLRGKEFFNSEEYPQIHFVGFIEDMDDPSPLLYGDVTMRGIRNTEEDFIVTITEDTISGIFVLSNREYGIDSVLVAGTTDLEFEFSK